METDMKWGQLAAPIYASDNVTIQRAQSLLTGSLLGGVCPPLTPEQAKDVLRWNENRGGSMKDYYFWVCHRCGFDDNRNNHKYCKKCDQQIRCDAAGGHHWEPEEKHCKNGCGRLQNGKTDLSARRANY